MPNSFRTTLRYLPGLLMLMLVTPGPAQPLPQGAPGDVESSWWYPMGDAGASGRNPTPTASQTAADLRVKWRTTALKNSPVLLVGAIRTPQNESYQQIVGLEEGTLKATLLNPYGFVDTTFTLPQQNIRRLQLTGLFDTNASTIHSGSRPNVIGIGVEQQVRTNAIPQGLFVDRDGRPVYRLGITNLEVQKVANNTDTNNRRLTVLPVAVYKPQPDERPVAVGLTQQDRFVRAGSPNVETMVNSVRKYTLTRTASDQFVQALGSPFYVAFKPYETQPALTMTDAGTDFAIALSPSRYSFATPISLSSGTTPDVPTSSDLPLLAYLDLDSATPSRLEINPTFSTGLISGQSQISPLRLETTGGVRDAHGRLITQRKPENRESEPRFEFKGDGNPVSSYSAAGKDDSQQGWSAVFADVDGSAPGVPSTQLVNNPGPEIITTAYPTGASVRDRSWLSVFRWNLAHTFDGGRTFYYFTRQLVPGQVVAAGDLVADEHGRDELVLVKEDSLFVLQMKEYNVETFANIDEESNAPFSFIASFALDDDIVGVAIADLEGDGENDIIVSTAGSTYAIGIVQPNPFPFTLEPGTEYCPNDTVKVAWTRNVGGPSEGLDVRIIGDGIATIPFGPNATQGDKLAFTGNDPSLPAGTYRVVVRNAAFPYIADTSGTFSITESSIGNLTFQNSTPYEPGMVLTDAVNLRCIDTFTVQRRDRQGDWVDLTGNDVDIDIDGSVGSIKIPLSCPEFMQCGSDNSSRVYFRLRTPGGQTTEERSIEIRLPRAEINIEPGDTSTSYTRTLIWNRAEFSCATLEVLISADTGRTWKPFLENVPSVQGLVELEIPTSYANDSLLFCVHCEDTTQCRYGLKGLRVRQPTPGINYVYPNPFDPEGSGPTGGIAEIVYHLPEASVVSITIYDASRTVVRRVIESEMRSEGVIRRDKWDGRDSKGKKVANGTYICVIASDSGYQIVLPIVIVQRQ